MDELFKILIGLVVLVLGILIGNFLARVTKEELKSGQKWFRLIVIFSLIGGFVGLLFGNDVLMFSLFFIAVVTSRSLKNKIKINGEL
ncbi:MAG: hypothetical protein KJ983_00405 [Candidatus Omnitrophica bacterium]|nr:hypothetical protein [Candidatus Omnitrophota bacterium]